MTDLDRIIELLETSARRTFNDIPKHGRYGFLMRPALNYGLEHGIFTEEEVAREHEEFLKKEVESVLEYVSTYGKDNSFFVNQEAIDYGLDHGFFTPDEVDRKHEEFWVREAKCAFNFLHSSGRDSLFYPGGIEYGLKNKLYTKDEVLVEHEKYLDKIARDVLGKVSLFGLGSPDVDKEALVWGLRKDYFTEDDIDKANDFFKAGKQN